MTMRCAMLVLVVGLILCACRREKDYDRPLPPGAVALEQVPLGEWPRFTLEGVDRTALRTAIDRSLTFLAKPSAVDWYPRAGLKREQVVRGLERFRELLDQVATDAQLQTALRTDFRLYRSVGWDGSGEVLFTGYYTPIFQASRERTPAYRYPIYGLPDDLIKGADNTVVSKQRLPDGSLRDYPTYAELIDSGHLRGLEIAWLADPFDPYIINVQGSAFLTFRDGSTLELGYAGSTGHEYHSIPRDLIADGHIDPNKLSLARMREFFHAHPDLVDHYVRLNPRLTFFKSAPGGPFGCLGEKVTTDVSLAADKSIFPAGALCFVITESPDAFGAVGPYRGFRLDQDRGGAIQAPGRCDLYMGIGPGAEHRAGHQLAEGQLFYLVGK